MEIKTYKKITTTSRYTEDPKDRATVEDIGTITIKSDTEFYDFEKYYLAQNLEEEQRKVWRDSHRIEDIEVLESDSGQAFILKDVYDLETI